MSYTLLIWEIVPEDTKLYLIPNEEVDKDDRLELMKLANFTFINNGDNNRGLSFLNAALCPEEHIDDDDYFDPTDPKEWRCVFTKYEYKPVDNANVIVEGYTITRVVVSGFVL